MDAKTLVLAQQYLLANLSRQCALIPISYSKMPASIGDGAGSHKKRNPVSGKYVRGHRRQYLESCMHGPEPQRVALLATGFADTGLVAIAIVNNRFEWHIGASGSSQTANRA